MLKRLLIRDRQFYSKVVAIAVPITLQSLLMIGINLADTVMVGYFGETQLSAASLANQFYGIFQICCLGLGGGAAVMTAQYWGQQDLVSFKKVTTITFWLCIMLGSLFMVGTVFFAPTIMSVYTTDGAIIENGAKYFGFLTYTYLFQGMSIIASIIMRTYGQVKIPLIGSVAAVILNIVLNYVFIFGNFGAPRMEIAGAALATLISRIGEWLIIFGDFLFFDKRVKYRIANMLDKCFDLLGEYFRYSFPVLISDLLLALGSNAIAVIGGRVGAGFVSANAIIMVVMQVATLFTFGISSASSVIIGNTIGEGEKDKVYAQGVTFLILSTAIGLIGSGLVFALNPLIVGFYNVTEETVTLVNEMMIAVSFILVFMSVSTVMTKGVLRGGGDTRFLMVADIMFLWAASAPLGYLAAFVCHMSAFWIFTFLRIDLIIKTIWCIQRLKSKKWINIVSGTVASEAGHI